MRLFLYGSAGSISKYAKGVATGLYFTYNTYEHMFICYFRKIIVMKWLMEKQTKNVWRNGAGGTV
jgi:hypothetical protein